MIALLLLAGSALMGIGLVRLVLGRLLNHAEQALWGVVIGWAASTWAGYLGALALGRLSRGMVLALTCLVWAAACCAWFPTLKRLLRRQSFFSLVRALWRPEYRGLLLVLCLSAPVYLELFRTRMLERGAGGLYSGGSSTWFDLGLHLAITNAFLYGHNFPPVYTPFPPAPLLYPFLPDFQTALLVRAGLSLRGALIITGVALSLALTGIFFSLALRILRTCLEKTRARELAGDDSEARTAPLQISRSQADARVQVGAGLATVLFLLNGGLGFLYLFPDWRQSGKGFLTFWSQLEHNYANMWERGIHWANLVADGLLPQRTLLFGMPLTLICLTLFAIAWKGWSTGIRAQGGWDGARPLLCAGVLTGLLPLFHAHSLIAVWLIGAALFLLSPRRAWLCFFVPAALVGLPHLIPLVGHAADGFVRFQPGWKGSGEANWPLYWFRNIGVPLLLIFPAFFAVPAHWRRFYLAFVALLVFSLLVIVSPNDFDNIKLLYYWYAMTCILVAGWLMRLARARLRGLIVTLLCAVSVASGALALLYERQNRRLLFTDEELAAAAFARERTEPRALFLTAPAFNQPVLCLAGRAVVRANTDWLWSHGYEFRAREADVRSIYAGGDEALALLRYYGVNYVYLGSSERAELHADQSFFDRNFPAPFRGAEVTIYDTRTVLESPLATAATVQPPVREFAARLGKDPAQWLVEFPRAGYAIYRYYRVAYGRVPKYQEMMDEMREVGRGLYVGASGWEQTLENNEMSLAEAWTRREEFRALHDGNSNAQYVDALYHNVGLDPATDERARLVAALDQGAATRATVLRLVTNDRRLYKKEYNRAFVLLHYFAYLRRNPEDPPENGWAGYNYWLENLNRNGDYRSLTRAFLESEEYQSQVR